MKKAVVCPEHPLADLVCVAEHKSIFDDYVFRKSKVLKFRYYCSICGRELTEVPSVTSK